MSLLEKLLFCLGIGVLLFLAVLYIDPFHHWANAREAMRERDINEIATQIVQEIQKNDAVASSSAKHTKKILPDVPRQLQELGQSTTGCALETPSCHITNSSCVDLHTYAPEATTFPSDPKFGSILHTGYAIMKTAPDEITVVSCYSEKNQTLKVTKKILGNEYAEK